jgi:glycolate oxidase
LEAGSEIMRICVDAGGTITGEHGIGTEKRKFMHWLFSDDDLEVMRRLKAVFGAGDFFNPGKMFPAPQGSDGVTQEHMTRGMGPGADV